VASWIRRLPERSVSPERLKTSQQQ